MVKLRLQGRDQSWGRVHAKGRAASTSRASQSMQLLAILSTSVLSSRRQTRAWATVASRSAYNVSSLFSPADHFIQGNIGVPKRCDESEMLVHHTQQVFASDRSVEFVPGCLIHQTQLAVSAIHASDRYESMGWVSLCRSDQGTLGQRMTRFNRLETRTIPMLDQTGVGSSLSRLIRVRIDTDSLDRVCEKIVVRSIDQSVETELEARDRLDSRGSHLLLGAHRMLRLAASRGDALAAWGSASS